MIRQVLDRDPRQVRALRRGDLADPGLVAQQDGNNQARLRTGERAHQCTFLIRGCHRGAHRRKPLAGSEQPVDVAVALHGEFRKVRRVGGLPFRRREDLGNAVGNQRAVPLNSGLQHHGRGRTQLADPHRDGQRIADARAAMEPEAL